MRIIYFDISLLKNMCYSYDSLFLNSYLESINLILFNYIDNKVRITMT